MGELVRARQPYVERMSNLRECRRTPILFTELGYESRLGTAARLGIGSAPLSQSAQGTAYEAAFRALSPLTRFKGIWWWEWSAEGLGIGPDEGGCSPERKRAALVLEEWQR